ncbi:MAG: OmpA family protein [Pirellulales bacterium]
MLGVLRPARVRQTPYGGANSTAATTPQQQAQIATANKQLEERAKALDNDNKELDTLLAQSRQQTRLLQDQLVAVREQLGAVNTQLAQARESQSTLERKAQTSLANVPGDKKPGVFINSSLTNKLPDFSAAGIEARTDGDTIRIELPADRLFDPGDARLLNSSTDLINGVLVQIERLYPQQYIGIEGHTDNDPPPSGPFSNNHQLSTARASAMFDYMIARSRLRPNQLFVVGHGGNHPIVSNASTAGKARNRRLEIVIYPEKIGEK